MPLCKGIGVAPPRGERGLKCLNVFGAMPKALVAPPRGERGLKFVIRRVCIFKRRVAPPRGERGLKSLSTKNRQVVTEGRSPSWGAWIEICISDSS